MRKADMLFIDAIDMCKYVEHKSLETDLQRRLEKDMLNYMLYVCWPEPTKEQKKYIESFALCKSMRFDGERKQPKNLKDVRENTVNWMDVIHVFAQADVCFGAFDMKYNGKKSDKLCELFRVLGDDLCKDKPECKERVDDYVHEMHVAILGARSKGLKEINNNILTGQWDTFHGNNMFEGEAFNKACKKEKISSDEDIISSTATIPADNEKTLDELMGEFNKLTGLQSVKDEINGLINLVKVSNIRKNRGFKDISVSKHMVFTGNPGTGKTTVARLLANIYHKLGVLSKGQLIEVDRAGLVAGYTGQTAIKTSKVIQEAIGGILFIDEAYTLTEDKGEGDFGQEAVDTILKAMEDNRDDLVVIVAGYPDLMENFLNSNPGLKSRFNKFIFFEDYNEYELLNIFKNMCSAMEYKLAEEDENAVSGKITAMLQEHNRSFANARTMRNMLEFAIMHHASRIVGDNDLTDEELITIKFEDIENYVLK